MQNSQPLKEAFYPLAKRLMEFETGEFIKENDFRTLAEFEILIRKVVDSSLLFEDALVIKEINTHIQIIKKIQGRLESTVYKAETISEDTKEFSILLFNEELNMYLHYLQIIQKRAALSQENISTSGPKIKWLGSKNKLGTLIYDLWQGQEKSKSMITKKMIDADQKEHLIDLILNNFLDSKGHPFTYASVSDYLNTSSSKQGTRAKKGVRIEIETP